MTVSTNRKVELLAPAGNFEKLQIVLHYGADAVYLGGKAYSLRNFSENFSLEEMSAALELVHARGAKAYITVNIFARNEDLSALEKYLYHLKNMAPDGLILADPAVLTITRGIMPDVPVHLSTQANTMNVEAARFWQKQGIKRINAARELSLVEIRQLAEQSDLEIEAFVHGAMCISYSGRCLLSNVMAGRPSNQGMCCQPCRFKYALVEETRPGQYFPICEDHNGTYILNSKDLCMLPHLPALIQTGVHALKIEGRMKGINYAATTVKVYREALDHYYEDPHQFQPKAYWQEELDKITSRGYCTGFYLTDQNQTKPNNAPPAISAATLLAKVLSSAGHHKAHIEVRNQVRVNMPIELLKPKGPIVKDTIRRIIDEQNLSIDVAQPGNRVTLHLNNDCERYDLLRFNPVNKDTA